MAREAPSLADELGSLASFMERVAQTPPADPAELLDLLEDDPNLEIRKRLGSGGMGIVYLARDLTLDRQIAVKVLKRQHADADSQLLSEAKAMARLSHPHIVAVYEVRALGNYTILVMEYVAGPTLAKWLESEARTSGEIIARFVEAGRGLAAAHDAGLIHRDFKPANVIVGDDGRVRVADFGLALAEDVEADGAGTPAFMAPEQAAKGALDARADQFSFCVALEEALADAEISSRIRSTIERGRSERPDERWPSMHELLAALSEKPRRWLPTAAAAMAMAIGALLVLRAFACSTETDCSDFEVTWRQSWNAAVASDVRTALENTSRPFASSYAEQLTATLDRYGNRWAAAATTSCEDQDENRSLCLSIRLARVDATVEVLSRADSRAADRALDMIADATADLCEQPAGVSGDAEMIAKVEQVRALRLAGHQQLARDRAAPLAVTDAVLSAQLQWNRTLLGEQVTLTDALRAHLSNIETIELDLAGGTSVDVESLLAEAAPPRVVELALTIAADDASTKTEAAKLLSQALEGRRSQLGSRNPILYPLLSRLGQTYVEAGDPTSARPHLAAALEHVREFQLGERELINSLRRLAEVDLELSATTASAAGYEELIKLLDESEPGFADDILGHGLSLVHSGQLERGEGVCARAQSLYEATGEVSLNYAKARDCQGRAVIKSGKNDLAAEHFTAAAEAAETSGDLELAAAYSLSVGSALLSAHRDREALEVMAKWYRHASKDDQIWVKRMLGRAGIPHPDWVKD